MKLKAKGFSHSFSAFHFLLITRLPVIRFHQRAIHSLSLAGYDSHEQCTKHEVRLVLHPYRDERLCSDPELLSDESFPFYWLLLSYYLFTFH